MARRNCYKGALKLSKPEYLSAKYYALRYGDWLQEYNALSSSVSSVVLDGMPHGSGVGNPTEGLAIRRAEIKKKLDLIEKTAEEADKEFSKFILRRAINDESFERMNLNDGLYCSQRTFYRKMHAFYYLLARRI